MKFVIAFILFCIASGKGYSQYPVDVFNYKLELLRNGKEVNKSVVHEGDKLTLSVIPVNPGKWDGTIWYITVINLVSNDSSSTIDVIIPRSYSNHAAVKLTNKSCELGEINIHQPFGTESIIAIFSREAFPPEAFEYVTGESGKNEMLLLLKQSPLSVFYNRLAKGNMLFTSMTFSSKPANQKSVGESSARNVFYTTDSLEILYSPIATQTINAEDFPALKIVDPEISLTRASVKKTDSKILLRGLVADKGHGVRSVTINGKKPGNIDFRFGYFDHLYDLQPGSNTIEVAVENAAGFKKTQLFKFDYQPGSKNISAPGKNYLLIVGIDQYKYHPTLKNAVKDAREFRDLMMTRFGYGKEELTELYNDSATTENIYKAFATLAKKLRENDRLLIYYAGHGIFDEDLQLGYWVSANAAADNPAQLIPNNMISRYIRAMKAKKIFAIIDACYSGMLLNEGSRSAGYAEKVRDFKCRKILASGRKETVSDGSGGNSPFAATLLRYLLNSGSKEILSSDIISHVTKVVSGNEKQTPIGGSLKDVDDEDGEFEFIVK